MSAAAAGRQSIARTRFAALPIALSLALLALVATAASAGAARPLETGVTNIGSRDQIAFDQTRATGARFIRIQIHWAGVSPVHRPAAWNPADPNDPHYAWDEPDIDVTRAVAAGLIPVLHVDGAPLWAQRCHTPPVLVPAICDPDPGLLGAFATAAARRYSGAVPGIPRVDYWQGLNEPNLSKFFFPQYDTSHRALSPGLYRDLINAFYDGIKAVDRANVVIAAGLGPIAVHPWTIGPMAFARQMLCMAGRKKPRPAPRHSCGGGVRFDVFAIQPYTTGGPTHRGKVDDVQLGDLGKLRKLIQAADRSGRIANGPKPTPIWITEFSWDTKPPDPGGLQMRIATRWTAEALHTAWRAGIANFFWYSLRDDAPGPNAPSGESLESGLYFRGHDVASDRPKDVMRAFRFPLVAYPGRQLTFWGRTPSGVAGRVTIQVRKQGGWRKLTTVRANRFGIFNGKVGTGFGRDRKGDVRAVHSGQASPPFAMKPVADFRHPPFG